MESEMLERLKVWTHSLTSAKAPPLGPGGSAAQQLADSGRTSHLILALPTSEPATDFDHEKPSDSGIISAATTLDQTAATSTPVQTPNRTQTHTSPASAMASSSTQTAKKDDKAATEKQPEQASAQQKSAAALEEDDEFEDFPVDDWGAEETEAPGGDGEATTHLWEESWDDDDTSDDFSAQLKEELKKVEASKRR